MSQLANSFKFFTEMRLSKKLPFLVLMSALITGVVVSVFTFSSAEHSLKIEAEERLLSLLESRKEDLSHTLQGIRADLKFNAENPFIIDALKDFSSAWRQLGGDQLSKLQRLYINENPHPTGSKENLDAASDGSVYSKVHGKYHPWIRMFLKERHYYDIFLFNLEGDLVYSVFKELDYATNVEKGQYRNTDLGNAYRAAKNGANTEQHFFDFKPYAPSHGAPAAFISTPILEDGKKIGVLVYQMPVDRINEVMNFSHGLGESGEIFLVGEDHFMRNDSRHSEESTLLKRKVDSEDVDLALGGGHGFGEALNYKGVPVAMAYDHIDFLGTRWGMVAEEDLDEVLKSVEELKAKVIAGVLIVLAIVSLIGYFISKGIVAKILAMTNALKDVEAQKADIQIPALEASDEIGDMARALAGIRTMGQSTMRVKIALDSVKSNVMMADENHDIVYANPAVISMLRNAESDIKKDLPNFSTDAVIGSNIDIFHKNPSHQREMLAKLTDTYSTEITVAGRIFALTATPVLDADKNRLGTVVEWEDVTQERATENEIKNIVESAANGDFSQVVEEEGKEGFMLTLSTGVNSITSTVSGAVGEVAEMLSAMAEGDLTKRIEADFSGMFEKLKDDANKTADQLAEIITRISNSTDTISHASSEVAAGSTDLSHRTEQQASSLEETAASMEELSSTVKQNAESAQDASRLSVEANTVATEGGAVVTNAVDAMSKIEESSRKISDIIGVIDEIAFQTNLLALNAAVEAARAGDAGKGFAVVASEVRTLAQRSAEASKEIKALIVDSNGQVQEGVELVNKAGESLDGILSSVKQVSDLVSEIASASQEQASGIDEINSAVTQMDEMTQKNAALVEESTAAARSMEEQADELKQLVRFFNIGSEGSEPRLLASNVEKAPLQSSAPVEAVDEGSFDEDWEEF